MHKKVMLELPDGLRRWGYVTTEHSASSYGHPIIVLDGVPYGVVEIQFANIKIIVNDTDTANALKKAGYNPISRNSTKVHKGIAFPPELVEKVENAAIEKGLNFSQTVIDILNKHFEPPK